MRSSVRSKDGKSEIKNRSPKNSPTTVRDTYFQTATSIEYENLEYLTHPNQKFTELIEDSDF